MHWGNVLGEAQRRFALKLCGLGIGHDDLYLAEKAIDAGWPMSRDKGT